MKRSARLLAAVCVLVLALTSCDSLFTVPIRKIVKDPREYAGKEVSIEGHVIDVFSLVVVKYFIVRDTTGEIAVVTDRTLPTRGQEIRVRGRVQEAFSLGDRQLIVLIENPEKR